jgi:SAM-dependent methyltransferase
VETILDFPCGYGRVLRMLRARFPHATIVAGDIKPPMLRFAQRTFGAVPFLSSPQISELSMPHTFDLIWCGSLVTHLDEPGTVDLLRFFYSQLAPGGLCVFSAHGPLSAEGIHIYGLTPGAKTQVLAGYHEHGYGYADYEQYDNYGISIVSHERMSELAQRVGDWRQVYYVPYGWDYHHDVYGYWKPA